MFYLQCEKVRMVLFIKELVEKLIVGKFCLVCGLIYYDLFVLVYEIYEFDSNFEKNIKQMDVLLMEVVVFSQEIFLVKIMFEEQFVCFIEQCLFL